jgi:putative transposase
MGTRNIIFANDEYYHIFNRGVDKRVIFEDRQQLYYFLSILKISNSIERKNLINTNDNELVDIVAYCLLPNHFHLILKQKVKNGVSLFMQKVGTSYTKYFNSRLERVGSLFQGKFKAKHINGYFALPVVSTYVNLNYKHHQINPKENLVKSSIFEFIDGDDGLCDKNEIQGIIAECGGLDEYKNIVKNFSITFAENKGVSLNEKDFEF